MQVATVNLARVARETSMKVQITGGRQLALRLRIAGFVMALGARIAGPRADISVTFVDGKAV
jgi:hypothetical protein